MDLVFDFVGFKNTKKSEAWEMTIDRLFRESFSVEASCRAIFGSAGLSETGVLVRCAETPFLERI